MESKFGYTKPYKVDKKEWGKGGYGGYKGGFKTFSKANNYDREKKDEDTKRSIIASQPWNVAAALYKLSLEKYKEEFDLDDFTEFYYQIAERMMREKASPRFDALYKKHSEQPKSHEDKLEEVRQAAVDDLVNDLVEESGL